MSLNKKADLLAANDDRRFAARWDCGGIRRRSACAASAEVDLCCQGRGAGAGLRAGLEERSRAGGGLVTVDLDATIVTSSSGKEQAQRTWKHAVRSPG